MFITKLLSPFFIIAMKILSTVVFILTLIAAFGGNINPNYLSFPSILCLAFPYLAILTLVLTLFWVFSKKVIFSAFGIITIVLCLSPLKVVFPLGHPKEAEGSSTSFKIISWNVLHTQDIRQPEYKGNRAVEYMINSGADIICLTEFDNFTSELSGTPESTKDSLFSVYPFKAGLTTKDIKVLSKFPVERIEKTLDGQEGECRFDFFKINFPESRELIVGMVHLYSFGLSEEERQVVTEINSMTTAKESVKEFRGPIRSKMRDAFKERATNATALREVIDDLSPDLPLIVCGDFNDVPASWTYNIVIGDDMKDAYVETNFGPAITYNLHAFYFHIDQMLYRGPLRALDLSVGKINTSDHYPLIGEFQFSK